jgi:(p)ppGpp synthase/HD superfamily hydrolase
MNRREQARDFAIAAHGDQRYGARPYVDHLDAVVALLAPYGEDVQVVGYLHDTLEDTAATHAQIAALFGARIADCVALLSDSPGPDRKTRKAATYVRMAAADASLHWGLIAKAADRLANVRACIADARADKLAMYREEHQALRAAAWRAGLCDALWAELDAVCAPAARE